MHEISMFFGFECIRVLFWLESRIFLNKLIGSNVKFSLLLRLTYYLEGLGISIDDIARF